MGGRLEARRILVVCAGTLPSPEPDAPLGNGRAISVLAAREGASVACADVDQSAAEETARLVDAESGGAGKAHVIVGDVTDEAVYNAAVDETVSALGVLDGLVLNVGIGFGKRLEGTTAEAWDYVLSVNLRSHFLITKAAMPVMGAGGSIVFISSVAGLRPGSSIP